MPEGKARVFDHFAVLGNIAGQHADARSYGIQQGQGEAFHIEGQYKQHGIGEQLIQAFTGHPIQNVNAVALVLPQPLYVGVRMARSTRKYKFYRSFYRFISLNQQLAVLFRRKATQKQNVRSGL